MLVLHLTYEHRSDATGILPPKADVIFYPEGEHAIVSSIARRNRRMDELRQEEITSEKDDDIAGSVLRLNYKTGSAEMTEEWKLFGVNDIWETNLLNAPADLSKEETIRAYDDYANYHRRRVELIRDLVKTGTKAQHLWEQGYMTKAEFNDVSSELNKFASKEQR